MKQIVYGLLKRSPKMFNLSAVLDSVNITIWNGTTMENANRKYKPEDTNPFTLVIYQEHMEQRRRIATTDVNVITTLYPKLCKNPFELIAFR